MSFQRSWRTWLFFPLCLPQGSPQKIWAVSMVSDCNKEMDKVPRGEEEL